MQGFRRSARARTLPIQSNSDTQLASIIPPMNERNMQKAALRGEPSYVWRAGQQRRLEMILNVAGKRMEGQFWRTAAG